MTMHNGSRHSLFSVLSIAALTLLASMGTAGPAEAGGLELQQFKPMPAQEHNYLSAPSSQIAAHGEWSALTVANLAINPLVLRDSGGTRTTSIVESQTSFHVLGSVALFDRMELGMDVPVFLHQSGDTEPPFGFPAGEGEVGLGDIRLVSKMVLTGSERDDGDTGFAVAGLIDAHIPTGDEAHLQGGDFRIGPMLAADIFFADGHRVGTHVGYQFRSDSEVGDVTVADTLRWGVGTDFELGRTTRLTAEVVGRITPSAGMDSAHSPTEFATALKTHLGPGYVLGGGGFGIIQGYGTPDWRTFVGIGLPMTAPPPPPEPIAETAAPPTPDTESTPEPPEEPEDEFDGDLEIWNPGAGHRLEDFAISVDGSTEAGAIVDIDLKIDDYEVGNKQVVANTHGGWAHDFLVHENGRYFLEVTMRRPDEDEIAGRETIHFTVAGDHCEHAELHYCHPNENCSNIPDGTYECACKDNQTCEPEVLAEFDEEEERIELAEPIHFTADFDIIYPGSHPLLRAVAEVLHDNPDIERVHVVVHPDDHDSPEEAAAIARQRADSVRAFLYGRGIDVQRLDVAEYDPDESDADDDTEEEDRPPGGHVEFRVVDIE